MLAARSALPRAVLAVFGAPFAAQRKPVHALGPLVRATHTWDDAERRSWVDAFRAQPLTARDVHISFARSSGPGGQNVNKRSYPITLTSSQHQGARALRSTKPRAPTAARARPRQALGTLARIYGSYSRSISSLRTHSMLRVSGTARSRTTSKMPSARYVRLRSPQLHAEILRVASEGLRGETSPEQKQRVARLDKQHRERVKKEKQMRSLTKSGRRAKP